MHWENVQTLLARRLPCLARHATFTDSTASTGLPTPHLVELAAHEGTEPAVAGVRGDDLVVRQSQHPHFCCRGLKAANDLRGKLSAQLEGYAWV